MMVRRIKIAHQQQANKPIYLLATGAIKCGNLKYTGRYKNKFKSVFNEICDLVPRTEGVSEYDVSQYKYWDAINIYDDYIVRRWLKSISAKQVERFAKETEVRQMIEPIRVEFKRALGSKWRRIFKQSDPNDPGTPKQAWQIL